VFAGSVGTFYNAANLGSKFNKAITPEAENIELRSGNHHE